MHSGWPQLRGGVWGRIKTLKQVSGQAIFCQKESMQAYRQNTSFWCDSSLCSQQHTPPQKHMFLLHLPYIDLTLSLTSILAPQPTSILATVRWPSPLAIISAVNSLLKGAPQREYITNGRRSKGKELLSGRERAWKVGWQETSISLV